MVIRKCLLLLCLVPASLFGQQQIRVEHLSIPARSSKTAEQQSTQQPLNSGKQPNGSTNTTFSDVQNQVMRANFLHSDSYDYSDIKLPPLEELIEAARNNPRTEYFYFRKKEEQAMLKSVKRTWMRYISVNSSYQYGIMGISTNTQMDSSLPIVYGYSDQAQSWWSIGASINFPLDEIFDRRNRIRKQQSRIDQMEQEMESWYEEQKLVIIEAYANAGMYLALISVKAETSTIAKQQFAMSQAEFINGRMDMAELNRQKGLQNIAVTEFEQTKAKLYEAILKLETLSNVKILNK